MRVKALPVLTVFAISIFVVLHCLPMNGKAQQAQESPGINQAAFIIDSIKLSGNKITRDYIIYRELMFRAGDTLTAQQLKEKVKESRENLLNTSLFNFVTISLDTLAAPVYSHVDIHIDMVERWYIWPFPIFEFADRNFNAWLQDKDFSKVNYGGYLVWENFRGRKEKLTVLIRMGFNEKYNLFYQVHYINKKQTIGAGIGFSMSQSHDMVVRTINDTLNFLRSDKLYPGRQLKTYFELFYRPDIHNTHLIQLGYSHRFLKDTIFKLNPEYSVSTENNIRYFSIYYKYKSDFRDNKSYALNGYYYDVIVNQYGLGIVSGKDLRIMTLESTFRKYWQLAKRWYFASLITAKFSSDKFIPYFIQEGLGYGRKFVRGYEYYVVDGQQYGLMRSNIKFAIIPTRVFNLKFIPTEKFSKIHLAMYLNAFFDSGYVQDLRNTYHNNLPNHFLYGYGLGLDLVTYYDVVIRFEVSTNKMHETGFFMHFMAPI